MTTPVDRFHLLHPAAMGARQPVEYPGKILADGTFVAGNGLDVHQLSR